MKIAKVKIIFLAAVTVSVGLMGCNKKSNTTANCSAGYYRSGSTCIPYQSYNGYTNGYHPTSQYPNGQYQNGYQQTGYYNVGYTGPQYYYNNGRFYPYYPYYP